METRLQSRRRNLTSVRGGWLRGLEDLDLLTESIRAATRETSPASDHRTLAAL